MRNFIRKFSLQTQIIFANTVLLALSLIIYFIYLNVMDDKALYHQDPTAFNLIYWSLVIFILMGISTFIIDGLTLPAIGFIGFAKDFQNVDFEALADLMTNSDFISLANAFHELQKTLDDTIDKIEQKNKEISSLNEDLKNELIYKRDLVSAISHDIKTPLTVIAATVSAIQDGIFTPEETQAELENILNEVEVTKKMLQDTINVYRLDSEISNANFEDFQLIDVINNITDDLSKLFTKYKHTLYLNLASNIKITADKEKITTAIKNLVLNAIIHSPENSNIYINIISNDEHEILEIINTGVTIAENDIKNIFKPFFQIDKSRTKRDDFGNGLGLYITSQILNKHNFQINVENIDNGVKFYITF